MSLSYITLSASKKVVKESLIGGGAIVGKNVTIESITPIDGGNRVTFSYVLDDGQKRSSSLDVMNGIDGRDGEDAVSPTIIESVENNENIYKLFIKTKDKSFTTPNLKPSIDLSNIVTDVDLNGKILSITKANGTVKKYSLSITGGDSSDTGDDMIDSENQFNVLSVGLNSMKEIEVEYSGDSDENFPSFEIEYTTGTLYVNDNGGNNINFSVSDNNMEVEF